MPRNTAPSSAVLPKRPARRWLARLALVVLGPLAFFALLEGGLRLGGFGRDTRFFIPDDRPGHWRTNPRFTELFFPASFGLKPVNFRLPKAKPAGTWRVFVIGESAAMGVPEPAFGLAPQLQAQLRAAHPGRRLEVHNLGVTAINSHALLRIAREALAFQPDLLVVYAGNNEVVGPYGASSVVTGGTQPLPLIRAVLWVRSTRTGQLLQRVVAALRPGPSGFRDWRGMEMFAGKTVASDDPRLAAVRASFAANLRDILAAARSAAVPVVLSTVAVNVKDCPPFASTEPAGLDQRKRLAWQSGSKLLEYTGALGSPEEELAQLNLAVERGPGHAGILHRRAQLHEERGEAAAARADYLAALAHDALRFRADAAINGIIRAAGSAGAAGGVALVDAALALGSDPVATGPLAGRELFFEHVHFRWEGNFALARLLAPAAAKALAGAVPPESAWLDAGGCAVAVGYTGLGRLALARRMDELVNRPPFTGQTSYAEDRARLAREIADTERALAAPGALAAAVAAVDVALARDPENPAILAHAIAAHLQVNDAAGALALADRLAAIAPPSAEQAVSRAVALQQLGRPSEAEAVLLSAAAAEPYYFQTYAVLAQLWTATGQLAKAVGHFRQLVTLMPDSRAVVSLYGGLLARSGDLVGAAREWRAALRLVPDDESALAPLVDHLMQTGGRDEAVELMLAAHAYNPRSYDNNARLVAVFEERGDLPRTTQFMLDLVASGPVNAQFFADLAANLRRLGGPPEGIAGHLRRGRRVAEAAGDAATVRAIDGLLRQHRQ